MASGIGGERGFEGFLAELRTLLLEGRLSKRELSNAKIRLSERYRLRRIPSDIEILMSMPTADYGRLKPYLASKPTRNLSGVQVVAIMSRPHHCPHGTCTMCPGGPGSFFGDVPQSYTGNEPATMRALRNGFDPYLQIFNRLEQYVLLGIFAQKIELILMGGTFLFLDAEYKERFIAEIYQAMNDFSMLFYDEGGSFRLDAFKSFFSLPAQRGDWGREKALHDRLLALKTERTPTLAEAQEENDRESAVKCVGLTIETKPDYGRREHGAEMLSYGCTRVELGVQTLSDEGLSAMHRGHDLADTYGSIAELRDMGFKLNFHIMLGVPGVSRAEEERDMYRYFSDPRLRPDMVKLYPLMVMPGTALQHQYEQGRYIPVETPEAASMIAAFEEKVEPYCRIMRIQRDIPPKYSIAGVDRSNLRQYVDRLLEERHAVCRCIRCREIGTVTKRIRERRKREEFVSSLRPELVVQSYEASGGTEHFLSIEDKEKDVLLGFLRLRFPAKGLHEEITPRSAIVRELHVYGTAAALSGGGNEGHAYEMSGLPDPEGTHVQHKGYGRQLMERAEGIAREAGKDKMLVISGVGVRGYYRKLGYENEGPYMAKPL